MDYKELDLKVGLEIHQQLDTTKLFCNCPSLIREDPPHKKIKRVLFPSPGETGKIDIAALEERKKNKYFIYEIYNDTNCLVEIDEEPPKEINKEALKIALIIAKLLKMNIFEEIHVMRKTVVDGSNTSGFQRTVLLAINGELKLGNNKILKIESLCLEEDSARKIEETEDFVVYRLDRLGIPLVEITTSPDLNTPEEVKEAAEKLGLLLRSTKVKRGLGTIRQDINISIKDGERVEIKGAQNLNLIPEIVKNEIERQLDLLKVRDKLLEILKNYLDEKEFSIIVEKIRKKENIQETIEKIKQLFEKKIKIVFIDEEFTKNLESKILKNKKLALIVFPNEFKGIFGHKVNKKRFGSELAQRIVHFGFKGLIHSDEDLKKYKLKEEEINYLKKYGGVFIMIAFDEKLEKNIDKAIEAIKERIYYGFIGVPKETRKVNEDGTTSFLRSMPGKARMYPETDLPLFNIKELIPKEDELPKTLFEKQQYFEKLIGKELANQIIKHYKLNLFEELIEKYKVNPKTIAFIFLNIEKELKRDYNKELKEEEIEKLVQLLEKDLITKEAILEVILNINLKQNLEKIIKDLENKNLKKLNEKELKHKIEEEIKKLKEKGLNEKEIRSQIIKKYRIVAEVPKIIGVLNEKLNPNNNKI